MTKQCNTKTKELIKDKIIKIQKTYLFTHGPKNATTWKKSNKEEKPY